MARSVVAIKAVSFPTVVLCDSREQTGYSFAGLRADAKQGGGPLIVELKDWTLKSGDYSLWGCHDRIAVERKSPSDFLGTLSQGRDRFERELARLNEMEFAAVVVECDWRTILNVWPVELAALAEYLANEANNTDRSPHHPIDPRTLTHWHGIIAELIAPANEYSQMNTKTIYRTVLAWQQRFRNVHWWFVPGRRMGEITTLRILERFWKDDQERKKVGQK